MLHSRKLLDVLIKLREHCLAFFDHLKVFSLQSNVPYRVKDETQLFDLTVLEEFQPNDFIKAGRDRLYEPFKFSLVFFHCGTFLLPCL